MQKYKLTEEIKEFNGVTLYRIQALRSFGDVAEGDIGGWIEREENLSQEGNAWVYGNAKVYDDAKINSCDKILWVGSVGSRSGTTTFFAAKDQKIYVSCGCFSGDIDKFEQAVKETHGDNKYGKQYQRLIALAREEIVLDDCEGEKTEC